MCDVSEIQSIDRINKVLILGHGFPDRRCRLIFDGDGLACAGLRTCSPWFKVHVGQVVDVDAKRCAVPLGDGGICVGHHPSL